jgi:hypothetical protein
MRGAKGARWAAVAIVVAMGATACGGGGDTGNGNAGGKNNGVVSVEIGQPQNTLVPSRPRAARSSTPCSPV